MATPRILVVLGHPDAASFNGALATTYADAARNAGAEVETIHLADLQFDPVLHHGYRQVQPLEPDLVKAQELIRWCSHLVVVYPIWWGGPPALLKGFIDRALLPGFAFHHRPNSVLQDQLLKGRSARLICTMDAPLWYDWLAYRRATTLTMDLVTLRYCGFSPVRIFRICSLRTTTPAQREALLRRCAKLARQAR
jgi:putative NADPH-quinone reductase